MKILDILTEGVNDQFLYHGVSDGQTVNQILKSGFIKPQEAFDFDRDMDQQNGVEPVDRISLSRNQYLRYPYGKAVAQFVIDKNALRQAGYKVVPKVGAMMHYKYETEEQVYKPIPIKAPFVVEIQYDPDLKIPKSFLERVASLGIKVSPWRKEGQNPNVQQKPADTGPAPQTKYTDPKKLKIGHMGGMGWYVSYPNNDDYGTSEILGPSSDDKAYIQKLYKQIKDRVAKKLSFDDLFPARQYGKDWKSGEHEIRPGQKGWKEPTKNS